MLCNIYVYMRFINWSLRQINFLIIVSIADAQIGEMVYSQKLTLEVAYNMVNNVQYYLGQNNIAIVDSRYEANVQFDICVKEADVKRIIDGLTQKCEGQISIIEGDKDYFRQ